MDPSPHCSCGEPKGLTSLTCRGCASKRHEKKSPTPGEIAAACEQIQGGWTDGERNNRAGGRVRDVETAVIPVVEFVSAANNGYLREA